MKFSFSGEISSSKSLVNRFLILKNGHPELNFNWKSEARDVLLLKDALDSKDSVFYVGQGGTTLRFLALLLSTKKGEWRLKGEEELFNRPQDDLIKALSDLNCEVKISGNTLLIRAKGWNSNTLDISCSKTSQVVTGVVLAAVSSKQSITINLKDLEMASGYLETTFKFIEGMGVKLKINKGSVYIPKVEVLKNSSKVIEADWSSAFFVYSAGLLFGKAKITNLDLKNSTQPDSLAVEVLEKLGASFDGNRVSKSELIKSLNINIKSSPDLFPVLSVLLCFSDGDSLIFGAPQLKFKETDRINEVHNLLSLCGYQTEKRADGIFIKGMGFKINKHKEFNFDCSNDHRLVMAATLLKMRGYKINIAGVESINKSFPEYFEIFKDFI